MADSKTEKAKQKAAEVRDKVKEQSEMAEKKVKESVKKAEKSRVGKHIPTSLDAMTFKDIIKMTLVLNSIMTLGLYCIISAALTDMETDIRYFLLTASNWLIILFGIGGIVSDSIFFFAHLFPLFKVFLLFKLLKIVGMFIFLFCGHRDSWLMFLITFAYTGFCVLLDICYVYYLAIFEERMQSDDYDSDGMLKEDRKKEEV